MAALQHSRRPNIYYLRAISHMCCTLIHWHIHWNINVQQMKPVDTYRQDCSISCITIGLMESELSGIWIIVIGMAFECLYTCMLRLTLRMILWRCCEFNSLNEVQIFSKSSCEYYNDHGGSSISCLLFVAIQNHWRWPAKQGKEVIINGLKYYR